MANRTVGRTFTTPDGKEYRPSMFLTLTLPSYGPIRTGTGVPVDPGSYDYRRAALDALHFPKLVDRFWQNLRRCAGYKVQYFAAVEPQPRLAPHLHAAMRGAIPRAVLKQVIEATYVQVWWPPSTSPSTCTGYRSGPATATATPTPEPCCPPGTEALDQLQADPDAKPAHVMRFGSQHDMAGIIAPSPDADRAVRYLTKYLTKAIADPLGDQDSTTRPGKRTSTGCTTSCAGCPARRGCANWLRYGIQPDQPGPGLAPGRCSSKAHDREHLGCGGRRVLVSRHWSGKTLAEHKADRATVVREALDAAGMLTPDVERMAADVAVPGRAAPVRLDRRQTRPDHLHPDAASAPSPNGNAGGPSTTRPRPPLRLWTTVRQPAPTRPTWRLPTARPHPMTRQDQGRRTGSQG